MWVRRRRAVTKWRAMSSTIGCAWGQYDGFGFGESARRAVNLQSRPMCLVLRASQLRQLRSSFRSNGCRPAAQSTSGSTTWLLLLLPLAASIMP